MRTLKLLLAPGSISLLLIALGAAALLSMRGGRWRRVARGWVVGWCAAYTLLSLPVMAGYLVDRLTAPYPALVDAAGVPPDAAIVVLGSDAAFYSFGDDRVAVMGPALTLRVTEAARVQRLLDAPLVVASGTRVAAQGVDGAVPRAMHAGLVAAGVPAERILLEATSTTTYESALAVRSLLDARGVSRIVLVTSGDHMARSVRTFHATGLEVVPAPAPVIPQGRPTGWLALVPRLSALATSAACLHELAGIAYYAVLGRI